MDPLKKDEPFDPQALRRPLPEGLIYRVAQDSDREALIALTAARNPSLTLEEVSRVTDRELRTLRSDPKYRLYVADHAGEVIGFCRFYDSEGLPAEKKKFPAPEGWFAMGIVVDQNWRRRGVARFLSENRLWSLKELGAKEYFSIVDSKNLTSVRMHLSFGFEEVSRAQGFLHLQFEAGSGILFRKSVMSFEQSK